MLPFAYVYGVGGLIFAAGLVFGFRSGALGLRGVGRRNLLVCIGTAAFFMLLQGFQQFASMSTAAPIPYDGGAEHVLAEGHTRGTAIDYGIVVAYFILILVVGTWFGRRQKTTSDFFFGGQRFSWWLIAFSLVATVVGSYSFVKYSSRGFSFGLSSSQSYLNDWIWMPLLLFGWLPILYFSKIGSIPEYFGRRFGRGVRLVATVSLLIYLVGYVGVNLFTMGKVLSSLVGLSIPTAALIVAVVSASYVTSGGQTSVIMTDLLQGVMLLFTGLLILWLGIDYIGGVEQTWAHLPRSHRLAFPNFNEDASFPSVGIFWQDAVANSAMFYFLNQGIMMRFVAARSMPDARKAAIAMILVLMTVAAAVVGGGGWIAQALVHSGHLPETVQASEAFYVATELLSRPGVFGLVIAALTAALMSTVDTLITAVAAIVVNDLYRVYIRPDASESRALSAARVSSVSVTVLGVLLVPIFMQFDSIYSAHAAFTAAVTPPLVVALFLSVFWKRYTKTAAAWTLVGGLVAIFASVVVPEIIEPLAHGVPAGEAGDGVLGGMKQHKFMRALFGLVVSAAIGIVVTFLSRTDEETAATGLTWAPGSEPEPRETRGKLAKVIRCPGSPDQMPTAVLSTELAEALGVSIGDRIYVTDTRRWLGGLRSTHAEVVDIDAQQGLAVSLPEQVYEVVVSARRAELPFRVEVS